MAYDVFTKRQTGASFSRMGADAVEVAQAIRNPALSDNEAAVALKKGARKAGLKIGALSFVIGALFGRYIVPKR